MLVLFFIPQPVQLIGHHCITVSAQEALSPRYTLPHKIASTREWIRKMKNVTTIKTTVPDRIHQNVTLIKILKGNSNKKTV